MSTRPTGTSADADSLLALEPADEVLPADGLAEVVAGESDVSYVVEVTAFVDRLPYGPGDVVDWSPDERDRDPMLVFAPITSGEVDDAAYPRRLVGTDDATYVPVPVELLRVGSGGGLGLDLDAYDPHTPLLFEALATDETIGLIPVRFDDGTPFEAEPLPETPSESDPVAEETLAHERGEDGTPRPETANAPIDPDLVRTVAAETDVDRGELVDALETIERADLISIANAVEDPAPVTVGDRAVVVVPTDRWTVSAAEFDAPQDAFEAARTAHERQARRLLEDAEATGFQTSFEAPDRGVAVSGERDTAEWETTDVE